MKTRVTRTADGFRDVWAWSADRAELDLLVQTAARRGELVGSLCRRRSGGWELAARLHAEPYQRPAAELPAPPRPPRPDWSRWTLTLRRPELTGRLVLAGGVLGAGAGVVWLVWQALSGAARVASANAVWLIPVALAVVTAGLMALSTKRGNQRGHRCPGVQHCPSCNGH